MLSYTENDLHGGECMNFLSVFFKGILIGIGNIAPGVSGGALAIIFGLYEGMVDAIGNFFKDIKKNVIFLFPIGLGVGVGIISFSGILKYLMTNFLVPTSFTFAGLITGTLPILFRKANKKGFKKTDIIPMFITFFIALILVFLDNGFADSSMPTEITLTPVNLGLLVLYGFILAGSIVIPGISGSVILMLLGVYGIILEAISTLNLLVCIPVGVGVGIGVLVFSKLMTILMKKYYTITFYAILGFVIGSIPEFFPGLPMNMTGILSVVLFICGLTLSYTVSRLEKE